MSDILIKNAKIINEGKIFKSDILIKGDFISDIAHNIPFESQYKLIDASNKVLIPGVIDDQVHFREPGLTHKATINSESKAAIAGGVTSFIEMPNTIPQTTTINDLDNKINELKSEL